MAKNKKLSDAIGALYVIRSPQYPRDYLLMKINLGAISPGDPWVAAALGCVNDADIPDVALEFFIADVKSNLYDLEKSNDNPNPEPSAQ